MPENPTWPGILGRFGGAPILLALALVLPPAFPAAARGAGGEDRAPGPGSCSGIADDAERLRCYDGMSRRGPTGAGGPPGEAAGERARLEAPSYLSSLWELTEASRDKKFPVTPYRSNYILPYSYNARPNREPVRMSDPSQEVDNAEVKFQLSFKVKLLQDLVGRNLDLWVAYTQLSFWQFYDVSGSSPFRETDYEPEALLVLRTDYRVLGLAGRFVSAGLNHQSNGRSEPLSRSWNRIVANAGFERDNVVLVLNAWYRIPEDDDRDDNPYIKDFMGYGQVNLLYLRGGHRLGLSARYNLNFRDPKGAVQLDWSFPLIRWVSGYVQYFEGYGESLLDYDASVRRIGAGFVLKEW